MWTMSEPRVRLASRELRADVETPLSLYWKLAHDAGSSFLLESVTGGERLARYSIVGGQPAAVVRGRHGAWRVDDGPERGGDPLAAVAEMLPHVQHAPGLPRFVGGAVGYVGYDYARSIERLPSPPRDDLGLDEVCLLVAKDVAVFDHARGTVTLLAQYVEGEEDPTPRLDAAEARIAGPLPPLPPFAGSCGPVVANLSKEEYMDAVRRCVEYIRAGDCIQVVPSVRFSRKVEAHAVSVYRAMRSLNPSPYMFLLRVPGADVVGASPELLVGLEGRTARVRPIAGTRPRGTVPEEDVRREQELLADEKERAEHLMLVDLGRNDLGRVCEYGTVQVEDFFVVERYSHVMHIVSSVTGRLREGLGAVDLVRAGFPAGTVTGAPKVRAMQIIDELEPTRRGVYAGAVGYLSSSGDLDVAIAIRTAVVKDGWAHVQAGAGVVADSDPAGEYAECENKARAGLRAIEMAHGL
jgi:anthranilate synthase component 1